ncbi:hypothetical protein N0M98_08140 [Paenibacillus doosanensis]|uniref:Uncharacterized protein n=1 Tax=Paenibacillus konkukensis TaxID=2020716 RepID=A0ABY4RN72_9BACL|nr:MULTISPECIES: hypothetical protein [Paenibacillus]MCS7460108.1 hypothetical protein [Paenibacillus doosanensis]UQZ82762.1 hypothetical protein SK3146_01922 [Paenibacillus konkukensis]
MEQEQRTQREITYHVGWKRGKIKLNQSQSSEPEQAHTHAAEEEESAEPGLLRWNRAYVWRRAGALPAPALTVLLAVFPLLAFALSVWLVYELSIQPY